MNDWVIFLVALLIVGLFFIGTLLGIFNIGIGFMMRGSEGLYHGLIHIPLPALSLCCLIPSI